MKQPAEIKSLIHRALQLGWIRPSPLPEIKIDSYVRRELREKFHTRGLNSRGHPRRNQARPELSGLPRKTYHREYMRRWRKQKFTHHAPRTTHHAPRTTP